MSYTQSASIIAPALIIYVIDISHSMKDTCGQATKFMLVDAAVAISLDEMLRRSLRDGVIQNRYKVAIFAYNSSVYDVLHGIRDLADIVRGGLPDLRCDGRSDTAAAFTAVERLLQTHIHEFQQSPAPLICHFTDGRFTTGDPTPVVERLRAMRVTDGAVLVENVYVTETLLKQNVQDWQHWGGVTKRAGLADDYARFLYRLSSPLPESYRQNINYYGYHLAPEASMLFAGTQPDLIRLNFPVAAATEMTSAKH